jgi:hypothetical protein
MRRTFGRLLALIIGTLAIGFLVGMLVFNKPAPVTVKSPAGYTETVEGLDGIRVR